MSEVKVSAVQPARATSNATAIRIEDRVGGRRTIVCPSWHPARPRAASARAQTRRWCHSAGSLRWPVIDLQVLRTDPDRVRASQRARGASESLVDDLVAADQARRDTIATYEELRAEQKELGRQLARASGRGADAAARPDQGARGPGQEGRRRPARGGAGLRCDAAPGRQPGVPRRPARRRGRLRGAGDPRRSRGTSRPRASSPRIIWSWARCSGRSTWSAGPRCPAPGSTT